METISYILSLASMIASITASLSKGKNMKAILFLLFMANILIASSYLCVQNYNGAVICFIGGIQALINYFFDKKNKKLPLWLILVYALSSFVANLMVFSHIVDIMAILASLTYVMCIAQKDGKGYRIWYISNGVIWCLYDILKGSYGPLTSHVIMLLFALVGMIIHDRKKKLA